MWDILEIGAGQQQASRQTRGHMILKGNETPLRATRGAICLAAVGYLTEKS